MSFPSIGATATRPDLSSAPPEGPEMTFEDTLSHHANTTCEAVQQTHHLTLYGPALPAPRTTHRTGPAGD